MAWLKRIDPATATAERRELDPSRELLIELKKRKPNPYGLAHPKGSVRVFAGTNAAGALAWFSSTGFIDPLNVSPMAKFAPQPPVVELVHGAAIDAGDAGYVFLDHAEHREPALELAAVSSADGLDRWARWLEERGDPFAAPLRAMLSGHQPTTRETWWLEGVNRGMRALGARFEVRGGFLRVAEITSGALPIELQILHVLLLRASLGLEELTIDLVQFLPASRLEAFTAAPFLARAPWPATLRVLRLATGVYEPPTACVEAARRALPHLRVEGVALAR